MKQTTTIQVPGFRWNQRCTGQDETATKGEIMGKILALVLCIGLLFVVLPATATQWDKTTKVTFSQPVELPNIVLQPGTYVFRLLDVPGDRHVVQVFNADQTKLYTTILAIPNYRLTPTEKTVMPFEERPIGMPEAMHAWFYPGDNFGQEFVYPKVRAAEIAKATQEPVLAAEITPAETPAELLEAPVVTLTPEIVTLAPDTKELAKTFIPEPREPITWEVPPLTVPAPEPIELPKTASPFPFLALVGLSALAASLALRIVVGKFS
jgi:hypothetical protein